MMSRLLNGSIALLALAALAACSDVSAPPTSPIAPSFAGGTAGGGGGGGGTTAGGVRPCAILSFGIVNNTTLSGSVAPYWLNNTWYGGQASGTTEKSCDTVPGAVMRWTDETGTSDGCTLTVNQFVGSTYAKYGQKPMSRFDQYFTYFTEAACVGTVRTIRATLWDEPSHTILSTMTTTWIVG